MRIAFVGKGGAGKSTLSASFAKFLEKETIEPVVVFDADLNIHAPELLGMGSIDFSDHLSNPIVASAIKKWLIGENTLPSLGVFRKTTPPTRKSNIIRMDSFAETPIARFCKTRNNISVCAVGTYQGEEVGASCYHNNLAILENILSHFDDRGGCVVADMVAGVDAFAGTLHAQFDMVCLMVEPTKRSLEVYESYKTLAQEAGVFSSLFVIGNKIRNEEDMAFIKKHVADSNIVGYFFDDNHIHEIDKHDGVIDVEKLSEENKILLKNIKTTLDGIPSGCNDRLKKIWELHKKYINQDFIRERFGDLSGQIDKDFSF